MKTTEITPGGVLGLMHGSHPITDCKDRHCVTPLNEKRRTDQLTSWGISEQCIADGLWVTTEEEANRHRWNCSECKTYEVVTGELSEFTGIVNKMVEEGWTLYGPLYVTLVTNGSAIPLILYSREMIWKCSH